MDFDYHGQFEFVRCTFCNGPLLGHLEVKCPKVEYDDGTVNRFERYLKGFNGFRQALRKRENEKEELKTKAMASTMMMMMEGMQNRGETQATTQIVKSKQTPLWSGQPFEKWRTEVEKWSENNRASEED